MFLKLSIVFSFLNLIISEPYFCKKTDNDKYFDIYSDKCFEADNEYIIVEKLILIKSTKLFGYGSLCQKQYLHVEASTNVNDY